MPNCGVVPDKFMLTSDTDGSEDDSLCPCGRPNQDENMIGCDNEACSVKWFHFSCAGIAEESVPDGLWYCHTCRSQLQKQ
jgi:hypothetical protein